MLATRAVRKSAGYQVGAYLQGGKSDKYVLRVSYTEALHAAALRLLDARRLPRGPLVALQGGGDAPAQRALVPLLGRPRDGPPQARRAGDCRRAARASAHRGGFAKSRRAARARARRRALRLDDVDKADAMLLTPILDALNHGVSADIGSLLAEGADELSSYEIAHGSLRASALLQYLIAQTEDRRLNETLYALADRIALR